MLQSKLIRKTVQQIRNSRFFVLSLCMLLSQAASASTGAAENIGGIVEQTGNGKIVREEGAVLDAALIPDIQVG